MPLRNRDITIRPAKNTEINIVADIISKSFYSDPILTWIVEDSSQRLKVANEFFILYAGLGIDKGVVHVAQTLDADILGCAIWLPHDAQDEDIDNKVNHAVDIHYSQFSLFGDILSQHYPPITPYYHLFAIAVLPSAHGLGIGSQLIEYQLHEMDKIGMSTYLEATTRRAAGGVYHRLGYQPVGEPIRFSDGAEAYPMWRNSYELSNSDEIFKTSDNYPEVGSIIKFGSYDWKVLDVKLDSILVICDSVIDTQKYNDKYEPITWGNCTLRHYLNNYFYNTFHETEQARIIETKISNHDNPWFGTDGGDHTFDRIFLLCIEEVVKYFGDSRQLRNKNPNSKYFIGDHFNSSRKALNKDGCSLWWWLRTPGNIPNFTSCVTTDGRISVSGDFSNRSNFFGGGIRPALWLKL